MMSHSKDELDALHGMVVNWRKDYERHVDPRIRECGYITDSEFSEFLEKCYAEVVAFREGIGP